MKGAKGLIITGVITLIILVGGIIFLGRGGSGSASQTPKTVDQGILVRSESHRIYATDSAAVSKVTIVEFGDYRCPACKDVYQVTKQIIKDYGEKINFVFRNYAFLPDSATNRATNASTLAANAAECAGDQNKFWEMHDWLYTNQPPETDIKIYNVDFLTKAAKDLGVDEAKFKTCLTNKTFDNKVKADYADGQLAGIVGTPSFFVNGQLMQGVPTYENFKTAIDAALK